ncbi:MAG: hypothetical protein H3Z53_00685 [archaeon]|nr:hypothetical protein [archaeon]
MGSLVLISAKVMERRGGHTAHDCVRKRCKCCTYESILFKELGEKAQELPDSLH